MHDLQYSQFTVALLILWAMETDFSFSLLFYDSFFAHIISYYLIVMLVAFR